MNGQVKVTWKAWRKIAHSLMVHARVSEASIRFVLMYMTDHISPVLPIKYLIYEDGETTTPFKLATCTKPSVSHLRVLFFPYVVRKSTAHVEKKPLSMRHQAQKGFCGIFVGISQHQKGYLLYISSTRKIIYSYDVVFDESFCSTLSYTSQPYAEATDMRPAVSCIPCDTYPKGKMAIKSRSQSLKRGIYYLKLMKMRKAMTKVLTNPMKI